MNEIISDGSEKFYEKRDKKIQKEQEKKIKEEVIKQSTPEVKPKVEKAVKSNEQKVAEIKQQATVENRVLTPTEKSKIESLEKDNNTKLDLLAKKIVRGDKDFSNEELQLQDNYKEELETKINNLNKRDLQEASSIFAGAESFDIDSEGNIIPPITEVIKTTTELENQVVEISNKESVLEQIANNTVSLQPISLTPDFELVVKKVNKLGSIFTVDKVKSVYKGTYNEVKKGLEILSKPINKNYIPQIKFEIDLSQLKSGEDITPANLPIRMSITDIDNSSSFVSWVNRTDTTHLIEKSDVNPIREYIWKTFVENANEKLKKEVSIKKGYLTIPIHSKNFISHVDNKYIYDISKLVNYPSNTFLNEDSSVKVFTSEELKNEILLDSEDYIKFIDPNGNINYYKVIEGKTNLFTDVPFSLKRFNTLFEYSFFNLVFYSFIIK